MFQYSYTYEGDQEAQRFITEKSEELGVPREAFASEFRNIMEEEWRKQYPDDSDSEYQDRRDTTAGQEHYYWDEEYYENYPTLPEDEFYNDTDEFPERDDWENY